MCVCFLLESDDGTRGACAPPQPFFPRVAASAALLFNDFDFQICDLSCLPLCPAFIVVVVVVVAVVDVVGFQSVVFFFHAGSISKCSGVSMVSMM